MAKAEPKKRGPKPKYTEAETLQAKIDEYFDELGDTPATITGLSLHLGFTSRQALLNNEGRDDQEIVDAIKRAKQRVEQVYENRLHGNNPTGAIFALKNFGWRDQRDYEHSTPDGKPLVIRMIGTK